MLDLKASMSSGLILKSTVTTNIIFTMLFEFFVERRDLCVRKKSCLDTL